MSLRNPFSLNAKIFQPAASTVNCSAPSLDISQASNLDQSLATSHNQSQRKRKATDGPRTRSKFRKRQPEQHIKVVYFTFEHETPSHKEFNQQLKNLTGNPNYGEVRRSQNGKGYSMKPRTIEIAKMITANKVKEAFANYQVKLSTAATNPVKPSFVITSVDQDIDPEDVKSELQSQNMEATSVHRITSRATNQPTRLIRVFTNTETTARNAVDKGVKIFNQRKRCERSRLEPSVVQCFKCLQYDHKAKDCPNNLKCRRCGGEHVIRECDVAPESAKCSNCGESHSANYRGCSKYREARASSYAYAVKSKAHSSPQSSLNKIEEVLSNIDKRLEKIESNLTERVQILENKVAELNNKINLAEQREQNSMTIIAAMIQCFFDSPKQKINILQALNVVSGHNYSQVNYDGKIREFKHQFASQRTSIHHGKP